MKFYVQFRAVSPTHRMKWTNGLFDYDSLEKAIQERDRKHPDLSRDYPDMKDYTFERRIVDENGKVY
jgi:hypothetical protein